MKAPQTDREGTFLVTALFRHATKRGIIRPPLFFEMKKGRREVSQCVQRVQRFFCFCFSTTSSAENDDDDGNDFVWD